MAKLKPNDVPVNLHSLEQLKLSGSETRKMVMDTVDAYTDHNESKKEAEQLKCKLMVLLVYYLEYFGYDSELISSVNDALYSKEEEG